MYKLLNAAFKWQLTHHSHNPLFFAYFVKPRIKLEHKTINCPHCGKIIPENILNGDSERKVVDLPGLWQPKKLQGRQKANWQIRVYAVTRVGQCWACDCFDHKFRGVQCKHIFAVQNWMSKAVSSVGYGRHTRNDELP